jgi:hypothetical protein
MRPLGDDLIRSARWSLEQYVQPAVQDPIAASYLRAVLTLLAEAEVRSQLEWAVLCEERDELMAILPLLGEPVDEGSSALAPALDSAPASLDALASLVARLRDPVARLVRSGQPVPDTVKDYLSHQVERYIRCSATTGPAF